MPLLPVLSIHNLSFAGQILVWSGRLWISARPEWHRVETEFSGPLGPDAGFALAGAIDRLFVLINMTAKRQICFAPGPCRRVADDELILVSTVRFSQDGDPSLAADALADMLPPAAVRRAVPIVGEIATLLSDNGYRVEFETNAPYASEPVESPMQPGQDIRFVQVPGPTSAQGAKPTIH